MVLMSRSIALTLWRTVLVCLALLCGAAALAAPTEALDPDDLLLFDVRASGLRLGDGVHGYRIGEEACVDLGDFSRAVDLALTIDRKAGVAQGWAFTERNLLTLERARGRAVVNGRSLPIAPGVIHETDQGWCVKTAALAEWLDIELDVDMLESVVSVRSAKPLPAVAAAERAARAAARAEIADLDRAKVAGPPVETIRLPYKAWRTPSVDFSAALSTGQGRLGGDYEMFAAGEVAWLSADGRFASDTSGVPQSLRLRLYRAEPDAQLLGPLHATEAAMGDVSSLSTPLAARGASGRGATVTNRPLGQSSQFDRTDLIGDAPVGWDVELYRNGELSGLAKASADGRFAFRDVPLVYGSNRLEVVKYGPQGQVRRERRFYEVGRSAVPPGKAWWWAHALEENRDLIGFAPPRAGTDGWRFGAGVDYGIGLRTSASLSAHSVTRGGRRLRLAETEIRRGLGPFALAVGGAIDTRGGRAVSATALGRVGRTGVSARLLRNSALQSEVIDGELRSQAELSVERQIGLGRLIVPLHFDLGRIESVDGARERLAGARFSFTTRRLSATFSASVRQAAPQAGRYGPIDGSAGLLLSARLGGVALRGELNARLGTHAGLSDARIGGEGSFSPQDSWQASLGYSWSQRDVSFATAYSRHFKHFSVVASLAGSQRGTPSGRLGLLFSLGPDGRGRFGRMTSARLASTGAVAVNVLRDGGAAAGPRADSASATIDGVRLKVGDQPAKPDQSGWVPGAPIVLAALAPSAPVLIGVDPGSLQDPLLDPEVRAVRVIPRKGLVLPLELKVSATGVVEGRLLRGDGTEAAGEGLSLLDERGRAVASTVSDFDGSFLFEKVHYGRYTLALAGATGFKPLSTGQGAIIVDARMPSHHLPAIRLPGADALIARSR